MLVVILFPVVIRKLLSLFYGAPTQYEDPCLVYFHFAVRTAGVIDVAGLVPLRFAIDGLVLGHREKVFAARGALFFLRDGWANILNDASSLWNIFAGK